MKTCKKCQVVQEDRNFLSRPTADGLGNKCRSCRNLARKVVSSNRRKYVQEKKVKVSKPVLMQGGNISALTTLLPDLRSYVTWLGVRMQLHLYHLEEDDIFQDGLIKMLSSKTQPPAAELKPWGMRILKNTAIEALRTLMKTEPLEECHMKQAIFLVDELALENHMLSCLARLKPNYRKLLELRLEGLSYEEIAVVSGYTLGGLKSMMSVAKSKLKEAMDNSDK